MKGQVRSLMLKQKNWLGESIALSAADDRHKAAGLTVQLLLDTVREEQVDAIHSAVGCGENASVRYAAGEQLILVCQVQIDVSMAFAGRDEILLTSVEGGGKSFDNVGTDLVISAASCGPDRREHIFRFAAELVL